MGASVQLTVKLKEIGYPVFDTAVYTGKDTVCKFVKDTVDTRFTMTVNLYDEIDMLTPNDFDTMHLEERDELLTLYSIEEIETFESFEGDYNDYIDQILKTILDDFEEYMTKFEDQNVFLEVYV